MIGLEDKDNFMAQIQERWMKRSYNLESWNSRIRVLNLSLTQLDPLLKSLKPRDLRHKMGVMITVVFQEW